MILKSLQFLLWAFTRLKNKFGGLQIFTTFVGMEQLLTTKEACEYLKVSRQTLAKWKKKRKIKAVKFGGNIRYKLSDIEKALK